MFNNFPKKLTFFVLKLNVWVPPNVTFPDIFSFFLSRWTHLPSSLPGGLPPTSYLRKSHFGTSTYSTHEKRNKTLATPAPAPLAPLGPLGPRS